MCFVFAFKNPEYSSLSCQQLSVCQKWRRHSFILYLDWMSSFEGLQRGLTLYVSSESGCFVSPLYPWKRVMRHCVCNFLSLWCVCLVSQWFRSPFCSSRSRACRKPNWEIWQTGWRSSTSRTASCSPSIQLWTSTARSATPPPVVSAVCSLMRTRALDRESRDLFWKWGPCLYDGWELGCEGSDYG